MSSKIDAESGVDLSPKSFRRRAMISGHRALVVVRVAGATRATTCRLRVIWTSSPPATRSSMAANPCCASLTDSVFMPHIMSHNAGRVDMPITPLRLGDSCIGYRDGPVPDR
jgi:hypothetical protein